MRWLWRRLLCLVFDHPGARPTVWINMGRCTRCGKRLDLRAQLRRA